MRCGSWLERTEQILDTEPIGITFRWLWDMEKEIQDDAELGLIQLVAFIEMGKIGQGQI